MAGISGQRADSNLVCKGAGIPRNAGSRYIHIHVKQRTPSKQVAGIVSLSSSFFSFLLFSPFFSLTKLFVEADLKYEGSVCSGCHL